MKDKRTEQDIAREKRDRIERRVNVIMTVVLVILAVGFGILSEGELIIIAIVAVVAAIMIISIWTGWPNYYPNTDVTGPKIHSRREFDDRGESPLWKDPTADYYGKHGEFDRNDEDRAICEDMLQMYYTNEDADLEEHYGWENELNYESDDYDREEDY